MPLTSISIPQIKFGKRKERSQMWEMFTDDGRIIDVELDVLTGCCDDPVKGKGFLLDAQNQYTNESGYWVQVGWDRSMLPLCLIEETKILGTENKPGNHDDADRLTELVDQIYHEAKEKRQEQLWSKVGKYNLSERIAWLLAIPLVIAFVAFAMIWIKH